MLDIDGLMSLLANRRPIFHSEADFQQSLAWHIRETYPEANIRLEYRPLPDQPLYLDIWVARGDARYAIELKYVTRSFSVDALGERYTLKAHGAQDIQRYLYVKDITRLERVVAALPGTTGYAISLTNDSSLWRPGRGDNTADADFRMHEGRALSGTLQWSEHTGAGTMKNHENPHVLTNKYKLSWKDYSLLPAVSADNRFRYLAVTVAQGAPAILTARDITIVQRS